MREQTESSKTIPARLFLFFWSCVNLFDIVSVPETYHFLGLGEIYLPLVLFLSFLASLSYLVLNLGAGAARWAIITSSVTQVIYLVGTAPEVPNHDLIAGFINVSLVVELLRNKSLSLTRNFLELAKILVTIVYGFAFFHKLNFDFINPVSSCSTKFVSDIGEYYPGFKPLQALSSYIPISSIVIEGALATIYFLPRKLAPFAVAIGFIFHSFLAIHTGRHFFDFSSEMMTLLLLYIIPWQFVALPPKVIRWFIGIGFVAIYSLLLNASNAADLIAAFEIRIRLWVIFSVLISFYASRFVIHGVSEQEGNGVRIGKLNLTLILIALLNGLTPYLGLKTRSSFDMYSNLRVEGEVSNHYLIPSWLQLGIFTDDLVEVLEVPNMKEFFPRVHQELISTGQKIVRFELMALLVRSPGLIVRVRDERGERIITRPEEVYPSGWVAPWLMRKMIGFRPVFADGSREFCQW